MLDPVPPLAIGKIPVTPAVNGNPVALVNTPDAGVPKAGVVKIGLVNVLLVKVSVPANVAKVPVAAGKVIVVVPATAGAAKVAVPEVEPENPTLVAVATPKVGVTKVGEVANTNAPEPVSSDIFPANSAEVVAAKSLILLVVYIPLVTVAAFPLIEPTIVELNVCAPVNVCAASVLAIVASVVGKVIVLPSVPAKIRELLAVSVLPSAIVKVALVVGAVIVILFIEVAVATPKIGVTKVGDVALTTLPEPVVAISSTTPAPVETRPNTLSVALTF